MPYLDMQIVHRWLESQAAGGLDSCPLQVNYVSDSLRWENTLDAIKQGPRNRESSLVTRMVCGDLGVWLSGLGVWLSGLGVWLSGLGVWLSGLGVC